MPATRANASAGVRQAANGSISTLYSFANTPDGADPQAALTRLGEFLYGTTYEGGRLREGTIYRVSANGKERVLYSFEGGSAPDGSAPNGELLALNGELYGTTAFGGRKGGHGTVFVATKTGDVRSLYNFAGGLDGAEPMAGLVAVNGTLYGTTSQGGGNAGTVFAVDIASRKEHILHRFPDSAVDGTDPTSTLIFWNHKLYGTTRTGGAYGQGTVFAVTLDGTETVVYSLGHERDGKDPYNSPLTPLNGSLYGTTAYGGTGGSGVVFRISASGKGQTFYNFGKNIADGNQEDSGVIVYHNELYGTSTGGGANDEGTIFRIIAGGKDDVLGAFSGNQAGGIVPRLVLDGHYLYGALPFEGANGAGMVYRIAAP